jgi:outer membrane receptor for ferrienterochelin and colicin
MKKLGTLLCIWLASVITFAQTITINGSVFDAKTGEALIGANVYNPVSYAGTPSNLYGFFSLKMPVGQQQLAISHIGYQTQNLDVNFKRDTTITIRLIPSLLLDEVVIKGQNLQRNASNSQMSMLQLTPSKLEGLPVLLGETDIIKTLQLTPGVKGGSEGFSGFYVRGGGPDQNLILLDGVPVYNVNHLFGFLSVFNSDAIKNVTLIKGGYPARYGGRLSSVLDIRMKEGNNQELKGDASIGILSSQLMLEGPINKGRTSFMISGRRSYVDILTYPFQMKANKNKSEKEWAGYNLTDINAKINHRFNDQHWLYLSVYTGRDKFYFKSEDSGSPKEGYSSSKDDTGMQWGNITSALRWNYVINNELFCNFTSTFSNYRFKVYSDYKYASDYSYMKYYSQISDYALRTDFDYTPNPSHNIKFGANYTLHQFSPGVTIEREKEMEQAASDTTYGNINVPAHEFQLYAEDDFEISHSLKINGGLHLSGFSVQGKTYYSIEPRISGRLLLSENTSIKASYSAMKQYLHLLANSSLGLPTDLWVPATKRIKPQESWQAALGFSYSPSPKYEFSLETYYKKMKHLIDYNEGASFFELDKGNWEDLVTSGKGESYGTELFVQKLQGKTTGWIGYTLSWSNREFENISYGKTYPYRYDARHDISIVANYHFSKRFDIGATWVFRTGYPFTLEDQKYASLDDVLSNNGTTSSENIIKNFDHRNNYRMPNYHRLDIGFNIHKQKKHVQRTWSMGIYNAYGHKNPFMVYPSEEYNSTLGQSETQLKQITVFSFVPYIRWSIKF